MNEYEVQSLVMQARNVKPADKFVMICILKNVDWSTWRGSVRLLYISKKYDVNLRTLHRIIQRLKKLGWIKVDSKPGETIINVDLKTLTSKKGSVKMTSSECQNDTHNNNNNINTIEINEDSQEYASKQEALEHTSSQPFESLSYMVDERGKVPLHVLSANHRLLELERRWHKSDISKQDHSIWEIDRVREKFDKDEKMEDFKIYNSNKQIKKTWR